MIYVTIGFIGDGIAIGLMLFIILEKPIKQLITKVKHLHF